MRTMPVPGQPVHPLGGPFSRTVCPRTPAVAWTGSGHPAVPGITGGKESTWRTPATGIRAEHPICHHVSYETKNARSWATRADRFGSSHTCRCRWHRPSCSILRPSSPHRIGQRYWHSTSMVLVGFDLDGHRWSQCRLFLMVVPFLNAEDMWPCGNPRPMDVWWSRCMLRTRTLPLQFARKKAWQRESDHVFPCLNFCDVCFFGLCFPRFDVTWKYWTAAT